MMVFDRDDALQTDYLQPRAPGAAPPQTMVPSSADFVQAIGLGLGWGMVADLQRPAGPSWSSSSRGRSATSRCTCSAGGCGTASLDRLAEAIVTGARERLAQ